ncbi:hypothetical protein A1704_03855 [Chryseobacterium cucumeris]|uniref:hypothetical protein n=1 Tax=Chryseobacterium cucumeris TaxID=1813611 RepID=UPI00078729C7|nr:hypothetical protein [Chryseobacterium cucumeris]KYH07810.1 hypothetical protein A1704_03855 [Chryseobacterium cucumeris]
MEQEKYYFENPSSSLKIFSEIEIDAISTDYKNGAKILEIRTKYGITKTDSFFKQLPYKLSSETCEYCDGFIYTKIKRTGSYIEEVKLCRNCKHDNSGNCCCEQCSNKKNAKIKEKRRALQMIWNDFYIENYNLNYTLNDLSIYDEIHLALLIESYSNTTDLLDFSNFKQNRFQIHRISQEYYSIISNFIDRKILIPDMYYFDSFYLSNESLPNIKSSGINWILNINKSSEGLFTLSELATIIKERSYGFEDKEVLWKEVYYSEVKEYIDFQSGKYLKIKIDDQIIEQIVDYLLPKFPLSKAYALIYFAINSSMRYIHDYSANERKVNSYFRNRMNELMLKFQDHKNLKDYNRPLQIELNYFNRYVLKNILKQENTYFYISTDKVFNNMKG